TGGGADRPRRRCGAQRTRDGRRLLPAPGPGRRATALATLPPHVQDLRRLREEAVLREQPEPLDGGDEATLRPEPPARSRAPRRPRTARICLHPVPEGREGRKSPLISL